MGKTLLFFQKTKYGKSLIKHTLYLILIFVSILANSQDVTQCSNLPSAKFHFNQIDGHDYLSVDRLTFPKNPETKIKEVSFYIVIESESGDYNMEWGPFTGADSKLFAADFGPLVSSSENFQFSIQTLNHDIDCGEKNEFAIGPEAQNAETSSINENPLGDWEEIFLHIRAFNFEKAITEMEKKRVFNAEDAELLEFAKNEMTKANDDRFQVYFNIYPNPAENVVFIDNIDTDERELTLVIMDLDGNVKMKKEFEVAEYTKVRMNINRLQTGNYICSVMNKNGRIIGMKKLSKI